MLIRFFKNNSFIQFLGLLILGTGLWVAVFKNPPPIAETSFTSPFYNLAVTITENHLILILLSFIILFIQAIYLNQILIKHELISRNTFLTAFVYFVLMSHSLALQHLYPSLIASIFILIAIDALLDIELKAEFYRLSFRAGFNIGLASLFYFPSAVLLLFIWAVLFIYRIPNWRTWVIPIIGILTPYLFLFTYYFWNDTALDYLFHYQNYFMDMKFKFESARGVESIIITILAFFMALSLLRVMGRINEKKIVIRKKISIMFNLFFMGIIILFVNNGLISDSGIIYIPVAIFLSIFFSDIRKLFWTDLIFSLTVFFIIYMHFQV